MVAENRSSWLIPASSSWEIPSRSKAALPFSAALASVFMLDCMDSMLAPQCCMIKSHSW